MTDIRKSAGYILAKGRDNKSLLDVCVQLNARSFFSDNEEQNEVYIEAYREILSRLARQDERESLVPKCKKCGQEFPDAGIGRLIVCEDCDKSMNPLLKDVSADKFLEQNVEFDGTEEQNTMAKKAWKGWLESFAAHAVAKDRERLETWINKRSEETKHNFDINKGDSFMQDAAAGAKYILEELQEWLNEKK